MKFEKIVSELFTFEKFYSYYKKTSSDSKDKKERKIFLVQFYESLFYNLASGTYKLAD